jgi:hypothetical protein
MEQKAARPGTAAETTPTLKKMPVHGDNESTDPN